MGATLRSTAWLNSNCSTAVRCSIQLEGVLDMVHPAESHTINPAHATGKSMRRGGKRTVSCVCSGLVIVYRAAMS